MSDSNYTPPTGRVRTSYATFVETITGNPEVGRAEFDRWLDVVKAEARAEGEDRGYWKGYSQGLRDTLDRPDLARHWLDTSPNAVPRIENGADR